MNGQAIIDLIEANSWRAQRPDTSTISHSESPRATGTDGVEIYLRSLQVRDGTLYGVARDAQEKIAFAYGDGGAAAGSAPAGEVGAESFSGDVVRTQPFLKLVPMTTENAAVLHRLFPFTKPVSLRDRPATFGTGDRLGLATAGHIRAARAWSVAPVLAQQSVRENSFTNRTYVDVVAGASWLVFQEGYTDGYGADGDHLKTIPLIDTALEAHTPMITLDLTEVMKPEVADWSAERIRREYRALPAATRARLEQAFDRATFDLPIPGDGGTISVTFEPGELEKCVLMYGPALDFTKEVNDYLHDRTGGAYDLEVSIDETTTPTLPAHHLFIACELQHRRVVVNSVAPRFIGDFQKGIDYIGDVSEFEQQFKVHCAIAAFAGGYKISVHSGSDKFSVYPAVGRETKGRLHVKTSGTSWLVALAVIARHDPALYRRIHRTAVDNYAEALRYYHITADFDAIARLESVADENLPVYLEDTNCRQMLHISYGSILREPELKRDLYRSLHTHEDAYALALEAHIGRHIALLGLPAR